MTFAGSAMLRRGVTLIGLGLLPLLGGGCDSSTSDENDAGAHLPAQPEGTLSASATTAAPPSGSPAASTVDAPLPSDSAQGQPSTDPSAGASPSMSGVEPSPSTPEAAGGAMPMDPVPSTDGGVDADDGAGGAPSLDDGALDDGALDDGAPDDGMLDDDTGEPDSDLSPDAGAEPEGDPNAPAQAITYPTPPDAVESPLYSVIVNGEPVFVEHMAKFAPEMQVHYAHCSLSRGLPTTVSVTVAESFNNYRLSPTSRNLSVTREGNTLSFETGPNYLLLALDDKELLFLFFDAAEVDPPRLGDANVKNIADYDVDATGQTLQTTQIQAAIDETSGSEQNILYFPPGKYLVGELWIKSDLTLYLEGGAVLYGSNDPADFNTGSGGINIEEASHGMIRIYQQSNVKILGRGVIDANGKSIRAQNDTRLNLFKIEESTDLIIDGIIVRDPSYWNTLIYRSDNVEILNYKMVNCRPTTTTYNNTDGVNFDESTNGRLYNAFLYTGDDSIATKNEEPNGTVNTSNIVHEKVVAYSNSVGCKIGTKTMGQSMDGVVFRDIDVVKAGRALNIDAYDTAVVSNTLFEDIRVEAADTTLIALEETQPPDWREAANESIIRNTTFRNITSEVNQPIDLHGRSAQFGIEGVHFENLVIMGNPVTSTTDGDARFSINQFVTDITFE